MVTELERIYRRYFREIEAYLLALSHDELLAEELTQQVFFKAIHALPGFRGEGEVRAWLCRIAKNCYLDDLRKRHLSEPVEELQIPDPRTDIETQTETRDQALEVHRILHSMPEPYREVFSLRVFAQLSFAEIGEIFGRNQNWACVTYHRSRQKIKDVLEGIK